MADDTAPLTDATVSFDAFEPVQLRFRRNGWTPDRQRAFVNALAESGCVADACRTVGLSTQSAYALRRCFEARSFRLAWDAALDYAIRRLSDAAISRALHGVPVPHYYKGEVVGEHRRYDERLTMFLLRYRDPLRYAKSLDRQSYAGHDELFAVRLARKALQVETDPEGSDFLAGARPRRRRRRRRGRGAPGAGTDVAALLDAQLRALEEGPREPAGGGGAGGDAAST